MLTTATRRALQRAMVGLLIWSVGVCAVPFTAWAGPVGHPLMPSQPPGRGISGREKAVAMALDMREASQSPWKISMLWDIVLDKDINSGSESVNGSIEGQWYLAKVSYRVTDQVELYGLAGGANLDAGWHSTVARDTVDVNGRTSLAWGGGAKIVVWEDQASGWAIVADAQYREASLELDSVEIGGIQQNVTNDDFTVREWQGAVVGSKQFTPWGMPMTPYAGFSIGDSDTRAAFRLLDGRLIQLSGNDETKIGLVLGLEVVPTRKSNLAMTTEFRALNENAFTAGGTLRF